MKQLIAAIVLTLIFIFSINAWATCSALEYAEIKDLDNEELVKKIANNERYFTYLKKSIEIDIKLQATGMRVNTDKKFKDAEVCALQLERMKRELKKREKTSNTEAPK